ncbi:MAG: sugar-binding protein, partial [Phycisphaerae bacterium]
MRAKSPPKLDGKLDDEAWKASPPCHLARTLDGSGSAPQPTEVRLLRDDRTLYVAFRCTEPLLDKLVASRRGHDGPIWEDDSIEMFLGPAGGAYYHLGVNAVGSTYDAVAKDRSWSSGLAAASGRERGAWTLEVAVPLAKMAGKAQMPAQWVANFNRNRRATGIWQETAWSPTYSGDSHVPGRFGRMLLRAPPAPSGEERPAPAVRKESVEVLPAAEGPGVVRFDLSDLPKGAKVHRADLLVFRTIQVDGRMEESRIDIDVRPLFSKFASGGRPQGAGDPLELRPPWYDRLDATEAVRRWVSGRPNGGFFVKACPFWNAEATCLDVAYEGKANGAPPQVTGVAAFCRSGQTFITWKEIDDPVGRDEIAWGELKGIIDELDAKRRVRYCVYRHDKRITAANLHEAELIAAVKPLSCWNVTGRNTDRPVDEFIASGKVLMTGHWNPFGNATVDGQYGRDCLIERLAVRDGEAPLPRGTGLYVHTAARKGSAFYAVVTSIDGVQN